MTPPAIVLAAGQSTRMGRDKALLPWLQDEPLAAWTLRQLSADGWQPVLVAGPHNAAPLARLLGAERVLLHPHPEAGKLSTVRRGLSHVAGQPGPLLITAIDQPRPPVVYRQLLDHALAQPSRIHLPEFAGGHAHPVVFGARQRPLLSTLEEDSNGLRGLLDRHRAQTLRWPFGLAVRDFNHPEAFSQAKELAATW